MKKRIYTGFLIVCILAVYMMMFGFSAQNGLESGGLSFFLSKKLVQIADCFEAGEWLKTDKKRIPLVGGILFLSGLADEIHQWFVPGRYASIWDVCLDFAGGMTGMLLLLFIRRIALGRKQLSCQSDG